MKNTEALPKLEAAMESMRRAINKNVERLGSDLQLTRTQLGIIKLLSDNHEQTTGELAARLYLTQSAVTQTVDTLFRRGLIARQTDGQDRRITLLSLTSSGHKIASMLRRQRQKNLEALISQLSEAEVEAMITATEKFAELIASQRYPKSS